jgi:hypothetical protein
MGAAQAVIAVQKSEAAVTPARRVNQQAGAQQVGAQQAGAQQAGAQQVWAREAAEERMGARPSVATLRGCCPTQPKLVRRSSRAR